MIPALEAECVTEAQVRGVTLPSDWSVRNVVEELSKAMMDVQPAVWKMAASLRRSGTRTSIPSANVEGEGLMSYCSQPPGGS